MKKNTGKQLMNLGLKLAAMIKDKLIARVRQIWREMQFTEQEKNTLKELLSKKGKREQILDDIKDEVSQKMGLSSANGEAYRNLEEKVEKLKDKLKQLGEE